MIMKIFALIIICLMLSGCPLTPIIKADHTSQVLRVTELCEKGHFEISATKKSTSSTVTFSCEI